MSSYQNNNAASNATHRENQGTGQQQGRQGMSPDQKHDQPRKGSGMQNEPRNASNTAQSGNR